MSVKDTFKSVFILFTIMGLFGFAIALYSKTLVSPYPPAIVSFILAALSGITLWQLWKPLFGCTKFLPNYLLHVVAATALLLALFFSLNNYLADKETIHDIKAEVVKTYTTTHYHSKRVSKNHYVRGEPYKRYHVTLRFENGREKSMIVTRSRFNKLHRGQFLSLSIAQGLFHIPVILEDI